jgi:hypothetical protein
MDVTKATAAQYKKELLSNKTRGSEHPLTPEGRAIRLAALRARAERLSGRFQAALLAELAKIEAAPPGQVQQEEQPERGRKRRAKESVEAPAKESKKDKESKKGKESEKDKANKKGMANKKKVAGVGVSVEGVGLGGFRNRQRVLHYTSCEARGPGLGGVATAQRFGGVMLPGRCSVRRPPSLGREPLTKCAAVHIADSQARRVRLVAAFPFLFARCGSVRARTPRDARAQESV